ncbi:MAG: helix-turn-helix transcriptional regulator [Paludibacteraceae bacterium]|nr:helix-turn-helix transcriptional regulator [Paludibacteraceae bacterium]
MNAIVGRNLKIMRESNGYTQADIVAFLGINRSAYSNYESGDREAPLDVLEKVASLFGCELSLLYEEDETALQDVLVCAFRADNLDKNDMNEIASFKSVVLNYLKMERLLEK